MTADTRLGSLFFCAVVCASCTRSYADPLGVADKGIWSDLDAQVQLQLPEKLAPERVTATVDRKHAVVVLSIDGFPRKAYPLGGAATLKLGELELALRPGDRDELRPLLSAARTSEGAAAHDRDGDG